MNTPLAMIGTILVLLMVGAGTLLYIANSMQPPLEQREEVISNDQFPG